MPIPASPPNTAAREFSWLRLIRLAPAQTAATAAWTVAAAGAALMLPAVSAAAVDQILTNREYGLTLAAVTGLLVLRVLAEVYGGLARVSATTRVVASLRNRLLRHVFVLGIPVLRRHATGDLVTRLTGNTATAARAVTALVDGVVAVITSFGGLIALWLIDWRLGVVFLAGVVPAVFLLRLLMGQVTAMYGEYLERLGAIATRLTDALAGSRTIRAFGTARREVGRVLAPLPGLARAGWRIWEVQRAVSWQVDLVLTAIRVLVLAVAGFGVADGRISPGDFLASSLYLTFALGFLYQVDTLMYLADARANADRVLEVLAEEPHVRTGRAGISGQGRHTEGLPAGPGTLSFRKVSVRLCNRIVLDEVDLDLPAGSAVALVGRSGTGKTTLAMLAGRLLDPDAGEVLIDGVRVDALDPAHLHREVAYAFDRPVLLGRTVREALAYGRPGASEPELVHAVRVAQAEGFIRRLPQGFDTPLADAYFSGGELQRLGLARAVLHGGRIFVLDDAMSSLDTVTEARVAAALTDGLAGRTRLVVAHRAATAARADLVAWLDGGRIRAVAPHRTLWAVEPDYRAVFTTEPLPLPDQEAA
jgi:ATP-binding cassette, subfamily B, bacterial